MQTPHAVLLYGHDDLLLWTRRSIFERAGYRTCVASEFRELFRLSEQEHCELLVLCHTVSGLESTAALLELQRRSQPMRSLMLLKPGGCCGAESLANQTMEALDGPEALLATAGSVLDGEVEGPDVHRAEVERAEKRPPALRKRMLRQLIH